MKKQEKQLKFSLAGSGKTRVCFNHSPSTEQYLLSQQQSSSVTYPLVTSQDILAPCHAHDSALLSLFLSTCLFFQLLLLTTLHSFSLHLMALLTHAFCFLSSFSPLPHIPNANPPWMFPTQTVRQKKAHSSCAPLHGRPLVFRSGRSLSNQQSYMAKTAATAW